MPSRLGARDILESGVSRRLEWKTYLYLARRYTGSDMGQRGVGKAILQVLRGIPLTEWEFYTPPRQVPYSTTISLPSRGWLAPSSLWHTTP